MAIGVTLAVMGIGETTDDDSIWDVAKDLINDDVAPEFVTDVDESEALLGVPAVLLGELATAT